jgi:site-specific recombinase XerD
MIIDHLFGVEKIVIQLLYASELSLNECLGLRVKDLDFSYHQIVVQDTKGKEDRVTILPD